VRRRVLPIPSRSVRCRAAAAVAVAALALGHAGFAAGAFPAGRLVEGVRCLRDPSQTYTLYLPRAYAADKRWPLLLVFDPRGRSVLAAELFRPAAEEHGWIVMSSDDTRSDGPMGPNVKAVNAMFPDAVSRFSSDPHRLYAAGFSGGAMLAWTVAYQTGKLAGVIAASGRPIPDVLEKNLGWAGFGTAGTTDFNYSEMRAADALLARAGVPHRLEFFDGPHSWMPEPLARQAIEWMELVAMREGKREKDDALIGRLWEKDVGAARGLESSGDPLAAMRRWEAIASTFDGLHDTAGARAAAEALRSSPAVARALEEEKRCDAFESRTLDRIWSTLADLSRGAVPMPAGRLAGELGVADLQRRAGDGGGCQTTTARRLLETIYTQAAFYMAPELLAARRYQDAVSVLSVAVEIKDDRPATWYNLACAHARSGKKNDALADLRRAVEHGYRDADHMLADPDLESLRDEPAFVQLAASLRR
jgi:predicted esterase